MSDAWQNAALEGFSEGDSTLQTWWHTLGDPTLDSLVQRAEESNLTLQEAAARGSAGKGTTRRRSRTADARSRPWRRPLSASRAAITASSVKSHQTVCKRPTCSTWDLAASWEIDVFGRVRGLSSRLGASYEASVEDYRDVLVSLFAEVARSYIDLRTNQARLHYAEKNVKSQQASLGLTQDMFSGRRHVGA